MYVKKQIKPDKPHKGTGGEKNWQNRLNNIEPEKNNVNKIENTLAYCIELN